MKILIIEDEELGVERLTRHLLAIDSTIEIVACLRSIEESVKWLSTQPHPELILMDIELTDGQSFEIFNQVKVQSAVIFTTSYDEFALKAFKVNSIDYLLKPVKKDELEASLQKYRQIHGSRADTAFNIESLIQQLQQPQSRTYRSRFLVKHLQRLVSVEVSEIAYFYAEERISFFVTWTNRKYVVDYTLEELVDMLDPQDFFRVNRAFIVHVKSIANIQNFFNGKLALDLNPPTDKQVTVSKEKASEFKAWMGK